MQGRLGNGVFLAEHIATLNKIVVLLVKNTSEGWRFTKARQKLCLSVLICGTNAFSSLHHKFDETLFIDPARNNLYNLDIRKLPVESKG